MLVRIIVTTILFVYFLLALMAVLDTSHTLYQWDKEAQQLSISTGVFTND